MLGERSKFPATISLYGACSEDILVQRSLGYQSESGYHRIRVDGRIRFEYATCGREIFESATKKLRIRKYPYTCGQGLILVKAGVYFVRC